MSRNERLVSRLFIVMLLGVTCMQTAYAQLKPGWVTLRGTLKNFNNQVEIEDLSEFQYLLSPDPARTAIPDPAGHFQVRFQLNSPNYFRLGRNILYLSPGDELELVVDRNAPKNAIFTGHGSIENNYLRNTPFPKGGSFLEAGKLIKSSPSETVTAIYEAEKLRKEELAAVKGASPEFIRLETARIRADVINSLRAGETYSNYVLKLKDEEAKKFSIAYHAYTDPIVEKYSSNFVDASLLKLVVYRDLADELVKTSGSMKDLNQLNDWLLASKLTEDMRKVPSKKELTPFNTLIKNVRYKPYQDALGNTLKAMLKFGKGDPAQDFVAVDASGKTVSLASLKGKTVYVDLWATWCGPCMEEMPYFEKLKEKYQGRGDIAFVSLSIDDDPDAWKKSVETRKATGYQWLINRKKLAIYDIISIPRVLMIDKDFKVAYMNGPAPSVALKDTFFEKLVGK